MTAQHSVRLVPWDDRDFVTTYEQVAADVTAAGISLHDPTASIEIQRRLRAAGYPDAVCYCERTVDNVLAQRARCVVSRDGAHPAPVSH